MRNPTINKLTSGTIAETIRRSDVKAARVELAFAVGAAVEVSGMVRKVVKRDGLCKLVIEPDEVLCFVVFADCPGELENLIKSKIRKDSRATVRGSLLSFGACAVNMAACRSMMPDKTKPDGLKPEEKIGKN